jgi:hypothetical protein
MNMVFKKTTLALLVVMLAAALPVAPAFAQGENPPREITNEQLEKVWAHQLKLYERLGRVFEDTDTLLTKAQELIDKAAAAGKDTSNLQSALNAFSDAVQRSRVSYNEIKTLITTHAGFDADGRVTDATQAGASVQAVRAKLQELKISMNDTGKALRAAVQAFREANRSLREQQ